MANLVIRDTLGYFWRAAAFHIRVRSGNVVFAVNPGRSAPPGMGGAAPKIENSSTNLQTLNLAFTLNGANSGNSEEINPVNGDLLFGSTVALTGGTQLKVFGNNGKTVTFNGIISGTASTLAINQN